MYKENNLAKYLFTKSFLYLFMSILGIISGISHISILKTISNVITSCFIKIFNCISLPIIFSSIVVTITNINYNTVIYKIWKKILSYIIGTTLSASIISSILYKIIHPNLIFNNVHYINHISRQYLKFNYLDYIINIIPSTIFSPFLEHQVFSILLMGIIVGLSINSIKDSISKNIINQFFKGIHEIFIIIAKYIITLLPIAIYGFITESIMKFNDKFILYNISKYISIVILSNLIQGCIVLPIYLKFNKIDPLNSFKLMIPALIVAFFSKSSISTLPVTIKIMEKNLNLNSKISKFVLPICTSLNMNGCAAFIFTTVIYLMQNNGINISLSTILIWIILSTITAIGNSGVPMGCFFVSASLLSNMHISIAIMEIILPIYGIIDMLETTLNVWSDSCIVQIINKKIKINSISI